MTQKILRSVLYLPASNDRAMAKAKSLPADALILDLEDAISPENKTLAREKACEAIRSNTLGDRTIVIRINPLNTTWGVEDIAAANAAGAPIILIPKVNSAQDTAKAYAMLAGSKTRLWAMMETPLAVLNAREIAASAAENNLETLVIGTNDLAKEVGSGLTTERHAMQYPLNQCLYAARAFGLQILDGVFNDFSDMQGLQSECEQGKQLGMDGKTLIHPAQIEICNRVFSPTDDEIAQAEQIVAEFAKPENASANVVSINGKMVERLHAHMAEKTLVIAEKIGR